jgi:predicted  nucleic acid-binding Zn-ribbon protein
MPAGATQTLRSLHRMLRQLADLGGRLASGPRQVAALESRLKELESSLAGAVDAVKRSRMAADQKQLQLKSAESKLRDLEAKLNACKTNREYQTLVEQIAADKMASRVLEDEILEALEAVDQSRAAVPAAEQAVAAGRGQLAAREAEVRQEKAGLEAEVARVSGELASTESSLPVDIRDPFRRAVKTKGADGMAPVSGGDACGGCFQSITGKMAMDVQMGRLVICRNCGRILYDPESDSPRSVSAGDVATA